MLRFFRFGEGDGEVPQSRIVARQTLAAPAEVARRLAVGAWAESVAESA
jgi:GntR family transcriptional regulator